MSERAPEPTPAPPEGNWSALEQPTLLRTDPVPDSTEDPHHTALKGQLNKVPVPLGERCDVPGYEILSVLGRGGMGVVYQARQVSLKRLVALKMILAGAHASAEELARFRSEAEAVARLRHPNIVQIYEVGEHNGRPYFSLEFVEGGSLAQQLKGQPQPPHAAADLLETLARAIQHAHQAGIVHRDLKPANVLMQTTEDTDNTEKRTLIAASLSSFSVSSVCSVVSCTPKITDFGLAKHLDTDSGHTRSGSVIGTPSYMPPEQAAGKTGAIGPLVDVYSLGAILYELLTGRPPFRGATVWDTLEQVRSQEAVPPSRLQPKVPRDLETICLKCLAKEPGRRYASALALADDLSRFLVGAPIQARPISFAGRAFKWVCRRPAIAGLLAALVFTAALGYGLVAWKWREAIQQARLTAAERDRAHEEARQKEEALQEVDAARRDAERDRARAEAALLQERTVRYVGRLGQARRDWQDQQIPRALEAIDGCPFDLHGWEWHYLKRLCEDRRPAMLYGAGGREPCLALSPDGARVAASGQGNTVRVWEVTTGQPALTLQGHAGEVVLLSFSLDGKRLASVSSAVTILPDGSRERDNTVKVWDLTTGQALLTFARPAERFLALCFNSAGRLRVLSTAGVRLRLWDPEANQEIIAFPQERTVRPRRAVFSPDGQRLALAPLGKAVELWDAATGQVLHTLQGHDSQVEHLAFSADGTRLASISYVHGKAYTDSVLKLWDPAAGTELLTIPGPKEQFMRVAFRPDGRELAVGYAPSANEAREAEYPESAVKIWSTSTGQVVRSIPLPTGRALSSLSYSRDGRRLAASTSDRRDSRQPGEVWLWDLHPESSETRTLNGHKGRVLAVAFSPHDQRLASAGDDRSVRIWDTAAGRLALILEGHTGVVNSVAFSPDGVRLASGSEDGSVRIWDAVQGRVLRELHARKSPVTGVAFSPDGSRLAATGKDSVVRIWDSGSGKEVHSLEAAALPAQRGFFSCVAFSPDGAFLATGGFNRLETAWPGLVKVWDARSGREVFTLTGHRDSVLGVAFSRDGRLLASASQDRAIRIWDMRTGAVRRTLNGHLGSVTAVAFSSDGKRLSSASADQTVKVWDLATGQEVLSLAAHVGLVRSVAFGGDNRLLASAGDDGTVCLWDGTPRRELLTLAGHAGGATGTASQPAGRLLATAALGKPGRVPGSTAGPGEIKVWDSVVGRELLSIQEPGMSQTSNVVFTPDGRSLAAGFWNQQARRGEVGIWDAASGDKVHTLLGQRGRITGVAISPDGTRLASGSSDPGSAGGEVRLWDTADGEQLHLLGGHKDGVSGVAFSPDGRLLATASQDATVKLWDVATGQELRTFQGHGSGVACVAFSPDGKRLASGDGGWDRLRQTYPAGEIRIWDVESGKAVLCLRGHEGPVAGVVFSPDGTRLATAGWDHTARVWDAATGREILKLHGHNDRLLGVAFSLDGRRLITASADQTVKMWELPAPAVDRALPGAPVGSISPRRGS